MRTSIILGIGMALVGCASDSPSQSFVAGFQPGAVAPGYTRFVTPIVKDLQPGDNVEYCQWVQAASPEAKDVLAIAGSQSKTGHHATIYATTDTSFAVGESHICTTQDMLSISYVGAIGGEGTGAAVSMLPDGLFFRLPAGQALMVNTHWLNATDEVIDGQAVIDLKFDKASDSRTIADLFANNGDTFQIAPGERSTYDVNCTVPHDVNFALIGNHMHSYGASAYTELVHPDATKTMVIEDPVWSPEMQFNPRYKPYSVDAPLVAHAGDVYHTHCEWTNNTTSTQYFPDEMCVGFAYYFPSQGQIVCENGGWGN